MYLTQRKIQQTTCKIANSLVCKLVKVVGEEIEAVDRVWGGGLARELCRGSPLEC